jgi:exosome complex RNA-binding protein Rrp4
VKEFNGYDFEELVQEFGCRVVDGENGRIWAPARRAEKELLRRYELAQRARARLLLEKMAGLIKLDEKRYASAQLDAMYRTGKVFVEDDEKAKFYWTRRERRLEKADRIAAKYPGSKS